MSNRDALDFLLALQETAGGIIPFERYMQEALYHPEFGYYSNHIRTIGRRGDFATSVTLGEALGAALAVWVHEHRIEAGRQWHVIEAGAGTGELARTLLRRLGMWRRRGLVYHIVETSPVLRAGQKSRLRPFRVAWHDSVAEALAAAGGHAVILSNELIDAFPCRVFERRGGRWFEVGVRIDQGRAVEALLERPVPPSSAFESAYADGQRVEIHVSAAEWLASWAACAKAVRMITIDYGGWADDLYRRRPRGTVRAYFHHQRFEGIEVTHRFGRQDITCDVNFTDLERWGECLGWRTTDRLTQAQFLARHGTTRRPIAIHDAALADHSGAGAAFKVLIQERDHPPGEADVTELRRRLAR